MSDRPIHGKGDIWMSDVLEAWRDLGLVTCEERAAAAEALGFDATALRRAAEAQTTGVERTSKGKKADAGGEGTAVAPRSTAKTVVIPSVLEEDAVARVDDEPSWLTEAEPLAEEKPAHATWKPPHVPLFRPQWTRNLTSAMCSLSMEEGPLDEQRLIDAVTRLRPVVHVPRRIRPTLRRGVHVLIDRGEAMMPFSHDVDDIMRSIRTTVGKDQFVAAAFVDTPLAEQDVLWLRRRVRAPWEPPVPGTPILLITDLGLSQRYGETRGATPGEWIAFAQRCRAAGCSAAAVVPRNESAWLPALRRAFTIIPWDQRTNVATVLRNMRARS
jgi:hypothetical protein